MPVTKGQVSLYTKKRKKGSVYSDGGTRLRTDTFQCERCGSKVLVGNANSHWRQCVSKDKKSNSN